MMAARIANLISDRGCRCGGSRLRLGTVAVL